MWRLGFQAPGPPAESKVRLSQTCSMLMPPKCSPKTTPSRLSKALQPQNTTVESREKQPHRGPRRNFLTSSEPQVTLEPCLFSAFRHDAKNPLSPRAPKCRGCQGKADTHLLNDQVREVHLLAFCWGESWTFGAGFCRAALVSLFGLRLGISRRSGSDVVLGSADAWRVRKYGGSRVRDGILSCSRGMFLRWGGRVYL